ncbi:MAG TPA: hypothetical protein VHD56_09735 [Tepidisphaeraceae bacterium]|nr:hypothetical protein [Tepidisphaeraceae bacterium]
MKFLHEPLVHFLMLGAILFGGFRLLGNWTIEKPQQIVVSARQIDALASGFTLDFKHPPSPGELDRVIQDYVREEVLCREADKLKLQFDDQAIRRLMRQRMESYNQNQAKLQLPTDDQLREFYTQHPDIFRDKSTGALPAFEEIVSTVRSVWTATKQKEARDAAYEKSKTHYNVVIEYPRSPATTQAQ